MTPEDSRMKREAIVVVLQKHKACRSQREVPAIEEMLRAALAAQREADCKAVCWRCRNGQPLHVSGYFHDDDGGNCYAQAIRHGGA